MTRERIGRHFILAFLLALALYLGAFIGIEHTREAKGPWRVTFMTDGTGHPSLSIAQDRMNITNVSLLFPEERLAQTNSTNVVVFDAPKTDVPFGGVVFLDTTFLPGTVTIDFFGHEIQLIPRGLFVNRKEVPWQSGLTLQLSEKEKILKHKRD